MWLHLIKASSSKGEVNTCEVMASHLHECPAQSDVNSSSCFDRKANALKQKIADENLSIETINGNW